MTLIERLRDLHKQATVERSHYYVGKCALDAADRIEALEAEIKEWRMIVENLESQIKADRVTGAIAPQGASTREAVIEECAKVCEGLRHVDYPSETSEWSSGTFDCAQALRALKA